MSVARARVRFPWFCAGAGGSWRQGRMAVLLAMLAGGCAAQEPPIVLGTTAAFSGAFAEYGEEYRKGADACLAVINSGGGVRGRPVRIEYLDDAYEAPRTVKNAQTLAAKGVVAFVNLVGTGNLLALAPELETLKIPVIGISSGAVQLREPGGGRQWIYHSKASYADEFKGFGSVLPTLGLTQVALVYQDNAFGKAGLESAKAAFDRPGQPAPQVLLGARPEQIAEAARQTAALQPQVVILIAAGAAAPEYILEYQKVAGELARVAVLSVVGGRGLTTRLGEQVAGIMTSMVYPSPWSKARRGVRNYQAAMTAAGQTPTLLSFEGCLNLRLIIEALKNAPELTPAGVRRALERGVTLDDGDFLLRIKPGSQIASTYTSLGIYRANGLIRE